MSKEKEAPVLVNWVIQHQASKEGSKNMITSSIDLSHMTNDIKTRIKIPNGTEKHFSELHETKPSKMVTQRLDL